MDTDEIEDGLADDPKPVAPRRTGEQWRFLVFKVIALTVVGVVLVLFITIYPYLLSSRAEGRRAGVVYVFQSIGKMMFSFEENYGAYPNDETVKTISQFENRGLPDIGWPGSSNYYFRQLVVAGYVMKESSFHYDARMVDHVMDRGKLLESGECAYSYVVWESTENLHEKAPLVMIPLVPGKRQFDYEYAKKHFGKKVVILYRDTNVEVYPVDSSGRVTIDDKDFFDPSQPYWGGQKPRIAWPE